MKKIFVIGISLLAMVSCKMDFYSSDAMTSSALKENPSSAIYTTDGIYALFKDNLDYKGTTDAGNIYLRHIFQLSESRGDNVTISGYSEDPFTSPYRYEDVDHGKNKTYTWWMAYKIIYAANSNIEGLDPSASDNPRQTSQLLGENYFFRAIAHFHMVTLFARPYVCGRDLPGVPLRIGMDYSTTTRASVGEVFDAIVADLKKAIEYMDAGSPRGDASYVSATAARALLARVYLFMGDDHLEDCVTVCNELIDKAPASVKGVYSLQSLQDYPKATWSSPETIWCVHFLNPQDYPSAEATIGAMYFCKEYETNGWGEWYWSDELIELFNRYKNPDGTCADNRFNSYFVYKWYPATAEWPATGMPANTVVLNNGKQTVCFPVPFENDACYTAHVSGLTPDANGDYAFQYDSDEDGVPENYVAKKTEVNGYTRYFIDHNFTGDATFFGGKTPAYIRPDIDEDDGWGFRSNMYMPYMNTKFSLQDGQATLSSPVILRWGEVFLNRAEANARLHKDEDALEDVNLIRKRAGLPNDAMFTTGNMSARGYESSLNVVLDERRMELCFEGDRMFSIFRNKKTLDRRYVGYHPFTTINYDDPRIALLIPSDEILASGIPQNDPRVNNVSTND